MENNNNESTKKGLLYQKGFALTEAESEVLTMLTDEFLTPNQIKIRRNCSKQAVYKIIKSLKQKGAINSGLQRVDSDGGSSQPTHQRLHAQQFRIRIINKTPKFKEALKRCNILTIDENTIRLYPEVIEIYSAKSFFGDSEQEATDKSLAYWKLFIARLENELGLVLWKPRTQNINIVKQHYAETNSQIAKECKKQGKEIKVNCLEDGKLAVIMDESYNLSERECIHPVHNKQHSEAITKQISDFIEHNPPTNSELATNINNFVLGFDTYGKHILSHIEAIQTLSKETKKLGRVMKGILKENQSLKLLNKHQRQLHEYIK